MKKLSLILGLVVLSSALEMPPMPPMLNLNKDLNKSESKKYDLPESCKMIPPMVILLPPPMEIELNKCKNEMYKPKIDVAAKQLEKLLNKKVTIKKIEIVDKFNQLYKITYDGGEILTNKDVNAFIKQ